MQQQRTTTWRWHLARTHTHNVAQKYLRINKDVTVLAVYSSIVGLKGIWKNFSFNFLKTVALFLNNPYEIIFIYFNHKEKKIKQLQKLLMHDV